MNKKIIVFLFLISALKSINAQNYTEEHYRFHKNLTLMQSHYHRGEYANAAQYPDSLVGNYFLDKSTSFFIAKVYSNNVDYINTIESLEKAVKKGTTKIDIEHSYDLDNFRENNLYFILKSNYDKWHQEYLDKQKNIQLDTNYINTLTPINDLYYNARYKLRTTRKGDSTHFISDSTTRHQARKTIDSLFYEMVDIITENGFPTEHRVGKKIGKNYNPFFRRLLYEIPDSFSLENPKWLIVKEMITEEMKNGKLKPFFYASFIDQYRLSKDEPQLYGTINYIYNYNSLSYLEYENPEELNIRRRSVGLCSIQLKLWSTARDLPPALQNITFK